MTAMDDKVLPSPIESAMSVGPLGQRRRLTSKQTTLHLWLFLLLNHKLDTENLLIRSATIIPSGKARLT
jgi:hypothetical protein